MSDEITTLKSKTCFAHVPKFYDGILEMMRIQQANDAVVKPLIDSILRFFRNSYFETMDVDSIVQYESFLNIEASGTLEQRRAAIIDMLNDHVVLNDDAILQIIHALEGAGLVTYDVDSHECTLNVHFPANSEHDDIDVLNTVIEALKPIIPLNLLLFKSVNATAEQTPVMNHVVHASMQTDLGTLEYEEPPVFMMAVSEDETAQTEEYKGTMVEEFEPCRVSKQCEFIELNDMLMEAYIDNEEV